MNFDTTINRQQWCPRFLINLNCWSTQLTVVKSWSTWAISLKTSLTHPLEHLRQATPWVKTLVKGDKTLDAIMSFYNFVHVLQILSKPSKFYQYESCAELWGTHFIFRMAFEIRKKNGSKSLVNAIGHCSQGSSFSPSWHLDFSIKTSSIGARLGSMV
jgi:hypothetical protein